MTIEQALEEADFISEGRDVSERTARATMTLAAEVIRLRARVEAVRNLSSPTPPFLSRNGDLLIRADVLAALEITDD